MKTYSKDEIRVALETVPPPIRSFIESKTLTNLILGISAKHEMNYRQAGVVVDIVTATLIGLEPSTAFETNLHQHLPKLSNPVTRELVADINDRIFKEAQRRLQENILEPEPVWDEKTLGKKENRVQPMNDEKLHELAEKERAEGRAESKTVEDTGPEGSADTKQTLNDEGTEETGASLKAETPPQSIAEQKTIGATAVKPESVSEHRAIPLPETGTSQKKYDSVDPYREPID